MPSTAIRDLRYDARTQALEVTFAGGRRYRYRAVPAKVAHAMEQADSKGRFFNAEIRDVFFEDLTRRRPRPS